MTEIIYVEEVNSVIFLVSFESRVSFLDCSFYLFACHLNFTPLNPLFLKRYSYILT